jgi:hypothetical protein
MDNDRILARDMAAVRELIQSGQLLSAVEETVGTLH